MGNSRFKFRAWDIKKKMWLHDLPFSKYFAVCNDGTDIFYEEPAGFGDFEVRLKIGTDIELMQYTGLKDRNGKEIYEGDVLNASEAAPRGDGHYDDVVHVVDWCDEQGCFMAKESDRINDWCFLNDYDFEVIGNIYETPDLNPC